jgi:hypothetical protein
MIYFLVLAGMAKKVFKTGAFNRSAIPPLPSYLIPSCYEAQSLPPIRHHESSICKICFAIRWPLSINCTHPVPG